MDHHKVDILVFPPNLMDLGTSIPRYRLSIHLHEIIVNGHVAPGEKQAVQISCCTDLQVVAEQDVPGEKGALDKKNRCMICACWWIYISWVELRSGPNGTLSGEEISSLWLSSDLKINTVLLREKNLLVTAEALFWVQNWCCLQPIYSSVFECWNGSLLLLFVPPSGCPHRLQFLMCNTEEHKIRMKVKIDIAVCLENKMWNFCHCLLGFGGLTETSERVWWYDSQLFAGQFTWPGTGIQSPKVPHLESSFNEMLGIMSKHQNCLLLFIVSMLVSLKSLFCSHLISPRNCVY